MSFERVTYSTVKVVEGDEVAVSVGVVKTVVLVVVISFWVEVAVVRIVEVWIFRKEEQKVWMGAKGMPFIACEHAFP